MPNMIFSLFPLMFILVFGIILFNIIRGITQWHHNNQQPVLTVSAKIVSKRMAVNRHSHNHDGHMHHSTNTTYYATFEVESGDRMELRIPSGEYGYLIEGDQGKLVFQGTRYHSFKRIVEEQHEF